MSNQLFQGRPPAQNTHPHAPQNGRAQLPSLHKPALKSRASPQVALPYSPEEAQKIQQQLNRVLGPEYVSCRPGGCGQNVSYIEGWKALNLANEIFGFNGWSSELISVQVDYLDSHGSGRVSLGLSVVVRITIRDGTFHEDFGYGNIDNAKNKAIAFEKCKKEAFTDALKRCLRCFGNVLGNCLYDKGIVSKMQKVKLPALELDWDDFHRDPLIVKREFDKQQKKADGVPDPVDNGVISNTPSLYSTPATANTATSMALVDQSMVTANPAAYPGAIPPISKANGTDIPQQTVDSGHNSRPDAAAILTPSMVKNYDLEDFDDLFEFSDDLPGNAVNLPQKDHGLEPQKPDKDAENAPAEVFFTTSKVALDVQKASYQNGIPVYDHKFVANGLKRTVDPSRSAKVRRADVPTAYTASQVNANQAAPSSGIVAASSMGKRLLGVPPSHRPSSKRLHRPADDHTEKENSVNV